MPTDYLLSERVFLPKALLPETELSEIYVLKRIFSSNSLACEQARPNRRACSQATNSHVMTTLPIFIL